MAEFKKASKFNHLNSISLVDGRFRGNVEGVSNYFSDCATMKLRVELEIEWLIYISKILGRQLDKEQKRDLRNIVKDFSLEDAQWIEQKDLEINHDTKAAEYFLRMEMEELGLKKYGPLVHIGLTSADIDNNTVMLSMKRFEDEYLKGVREELLEFLKKFSLEDKDSLFLAKTHGMEAMPTTMGKEIANYYHRLWKLDKKMKEFKFEGKLTGAVGNWNALSYIYPDIDWIKSNKEFLRGLDLEPNMFTTQILPYENLIEYLHLLHQYNYVLTDLAKNMWTYISEGYCKLKMKKEEVGSSTMAHKVNPIDFERCESNLIMSSGIIEVLAKNLPTNRLQRDLTDKYLVRELGPIMSRIVLGYWSIMEGLGKVDYVKSKNELDNHWEILSEAMQTILRDSGFSEAYEVIKDKTRGKTLTKFEYMDLVGGLDVPNSVKEKLKELKPEKYAGWAEDILKRELSI
jgi:adenylosuccinate lyase